MMDGIVEQIGEQLQQKLRIATHRRRRGRLHVEEVSEGKKKARREYEEKMRAQAQVARAEESEDPTLAAYNDHLASLVNRDKKRLWGH